jgi:pimeloyl-ACP methyl ester carboxylesterase
MSCVTLVCTDWGGGLLLTAHGLDQRVSRLVALPCEAFDNFPPGLPGKVSLWAARLPGGLVLGARQLRVGWLRQTPLLMGQMVKYPIADDLVREWTEPLLTDPRIRRDYIRYATSSVEPRQLVAQTEALRNFTGDALVLWSPENRVMPPEHGRRLAELLPRGRLVEVPDAYVLSMLDQPDAVAAALGDFLTRSESSAA